MDAPEAELDVKLQKISADLLVDLDGAITSLPRKADGHGGMRIRSFVRVSETLDATTAVLDWFQELPQLLDPHLAKWIPFLADAYLEYAQGRPRMKRSHARSAFLFPLDHAICRILYAFCKVRGEKVILRFLNVETRYLELLLSDMEEAEERARAADETDAVGCWRWEQRYLVMLWLSHQLLAPFDLSTISSVDLDDADLPDIRGLRWPENLPAITMRVIPLAVKYLAVPGREMDAAKALLVRVAMRRDMQRLGLLDALVGWALASLRLQKDESPASTFFYIGVLCFLAGLLRSSAETSDMDEHLPKILHLVHGIATGQDELSKLLLPLALVRKIIVKLVRSVAVSLLRRRTEDVATTEMIETIIGYLLESVSDGDTPVRLSASKALSIVTLKLDPAMASQVVDAVLESLNRNVLWAKPTGGDAVKPVRNLSAVSHLEWHGLTLTLSHLLYRRSPPASQLPDIIHALLLGLSFEQRSTSGGSVGSNVRDAACFGIWAVARRYTTDELLAVPTKSIFAAKACRSGTSILQLLAVELVTTASLDPAGNIRRGASAALQELIGRHPNTVEHGIAVVQTVDYHAVARRSRAIEEVAKKATKLSPQYGEAIVDGILGWRGIGDPDASCRRVAGAALGASEAELSKLAPGGVLSRVDTSIRAITRRIQSLAKRQVEERHGLLLCLASILDQLPQAMQAAREGGPESNLNMSVTLHDALASVSVMLEDCASVEYRKPELIAEAASKLVLSSLPILQAISLPGGSTASAVTGERVLTPSMARSHLQLVSALDSQDVVHADTELLTSRLRVVLPTWLGRNEGETVEPAAAAALLLLLFSKPDDRAATLQELAAAVRNKPAGRAASTGHGYFLALSLAQPLAELASRSTAETDAVCEALLERWRVDGETETRVAILQSLVRSRVLRAKPLTFLGMLRDGLDDYTTNARGDVGSHVRLQALRAVQVLWEDLADAERCQERWVQESIEVLFRSVLRLSAEKLDRVRPEAKAAVALALQPKHVERFESLTSSSTLYFNALLALGSLDCLLPVMERAAKANAGSWMAELLAGFVTSADTGNDDLVMASRTALTNFCEASPDKLDSVCAGLMQNIGTPRGEDRVVIPTLEVVAFLFHCGLFPKWRHVNLRSLCLKTQKAGYKSGSVRKLLACIKVYGCVASLGVDGAAGSEATAAGVQEARTRLGAFLLHPWPRVRTAVIDELWGVTSIDDKADGRGLMGVDWATADRAMIDGIVRELWPVPAN
ncbi:hypothetical protein DCS_00526 [Drechmeria coniospora]|uniref:Uncharacterized protein n=1 Tax=Drechmeria coniospora TaxID=98403 RepID=A0A151GQM1_DRECN|nr:hypothetical protein DCS_00526 [Drechmeria coniospora]KYK59396.1 hypothetical protein DCS_00526 [Drechmeria coniospora]